MLANLVLAHNVVLDGPPLRHPPPAARPDRRGADYGEGDMGAAVGDGETEGEPEGDVVEGETDGDVDCDAAGPEEITTVTPI